MSPHIGKVSEKSNGRVKVIRQKVSFWPIWGFFDHFWAPGDASGVFTKVFYSAQLDIKIQLGTNSFHTIYFTSVCSDSVN